MSIGGHITLRPGRDEIQAERPIFGVGTLRIDASESLHTSLMLNHTHLPELRRMVQMLEASEQTERIVSKGVEQAEAAARAEVGAD